MQTYLLAAAVIAVVVGIVHSALGEFLIFRKLRSVGLVPTEPASPLQSRNIRILWATWHLASVFGFTLAAILFALSNSAAPQSSAILNALIFAFVGGAALVLIATKGKHPGWVGLLTVAILTYMGSSS